MIAALAGVTVVVPARNEAAAIGAVVRSLRLLGADRVIVADDASTDRTHAEARAAGAEIVRSAGRGYGWACHAGMTAAAGAAYVGFIDGDGSFSAEDLGSLLRLLHDGADLAVGTRIRTVAMPLHQRGGNALTLALLRLIYGVTIADIAPLRVIRGGSLKRLAMRPTRYAWLVEMLAKAARRRMRIVAVPVRYGPRQGGVSKVSGSLRGSILAGMDFLGALRTDRDW